MLAFLPSTVKASLCSVCVCVGGCSCLFLTHHLLCVWSFGKWKGKGGYRNWFHLNWYCFKIVSCSLLMDLFSFFHKRKEFKADSLALWTFLSFLQRLFCGPWNCYSHEPGNVTLVKHPITPLRVVWEDPPYGPSQLESHCSFQMVLLDISKNNPWPTFPLMWLKLEYKLTCSLICY